jgi:hypothetical protein
MHVPFAYVLFLAFVLQVAIGCHTTVCHVMGFIAAGAELGEELRNANGSCKGVATISVLLVSDVQ